MLSGMAENPTPRPSDEQIAANLQDLISRAVQAQEVLVNLSADAIGIYLTEYCIEMEMRVNGMDFKTLLDGKLGRPRHGVGGDLVLQTLGDSVLRWLRNVELVSAKDIANIRFSADNPLGRGLIAMIDACNTGDEKQARHAIQQFVHQLYHDKDQAVGMISQSIEPGKVTNYREYVDNYVAELNKHEKALTELEHSGKLNSPKEYSNLRTYRRQFALFRDGLSRFPRVPDTLSKLIPPFTEAEVLPRNPISAYQLAEINALILQRKTNICREQERTVADPEALKGTFFDPALLPRGQDPVIMTLYETGKKSPSRTEEKVKTELDGRTEDVKDAARTKIIVDDIQGMMRVGEILSQLSQERGFTEELKPIRMNSRGAWDAKRNITVKFSEGHPSSVKTLCTEVQIIDKQMQDLDIISHQIYELMRRYPFDDLLARTGEAKAAGAKPDTSDWMSFSRSHELRVETLRDFVHEYNVIAERLNSNTSRGIIGTIRERDPELFKVLRTRVQPITESQLKAFITPKPTAGNVSPGVQPNNAFLQPEALAHLTEMLKNLQFLHQGITSYASLSRMNDENRGAAHPSMAAAYYLLATQANERQKLDVLKIPPVFLPNDGRPFTRKSEYKEFTPDDLTQVQGVIEAFNTSLAAGKAESVAR